MFTVRDKQRSSYELSSDSDDDIQNTVVAVSSPAPRLEQIHDAAQVPRRFSSDDRPITPMRNQMLYSMMLESHEFVDGVYCTDISAIYFLVFSPFFTFLFLSLALLFFFFCPSLPFLPE